MLVPLSLIFGGILIEGLLGDPYNYQQVAGAHHPDTFGFPTNYDPAQTSSTLPKFEDNYSNSNNIASDDVVGLPGLTTLRAHAAALKARARAKAHLHHLHPHPLFQRTSEESENGGQTSKDENDEAVANRILASPSSSVALLSNEAAEKSNYKTFQTQVFPIILNLENDDADLDDDSDSIETDSFDNAGVVEEASFPVLSITPDITIYDTNRIQELSTFMPGPGMHDNNFYQSYESVPLVCPENANGCLTDCDALAASSSSFSNLQFAPRQRTPLVPSTNERHHHFHHLDLIHNAAHDHIFHAHLPPDQGIFESFHSSDLHQKPILHAAIDQQAGFEPATHLSGQQHVLISGNNNAVSQSQSLRNVQTVADQQKIQSAQVFGHQDFVSQSQSSDERFSTSSDLNPLVGAPHIFRVPPNRPVYRFLLSMKT